MMVGAAAVAVGDVVLGGGVFEGFVGVVVARAVANVVAAVVDVVVVVVPVVAVQLHVVICFGVGVVVVGVVVEYEERRPLYAVSWEKRLLGERYI